MWPIEGRTVLFVSHNMSAIQELCKRVVLIRNGSIIGTGVPEVIIETYLGDASHSDVGEFDLSHHPARQRKYKNLIKRISLCDSNGISKNRFFSEEFIKIVILLQTDIIIKDPRLALAVEDNLGRRIFTIASYFGKQKPQEIFSEVTACCIIPSLNLAPGKYLLSVSVGTKADGLLDSIDYAAWLEIDWNNNYGNGEPYKKVYGPILTDSKWSIKNG